MLAYLQQLTLSNLLFIELSARRNCVYTHLLTTNGFPIYDKLSFFSIRSGIESFTGVFISAVSPNQLAEQVGLRVGFVVTFLPILLSFVFLANFFPRFFILFFLLFVCSLILCVFQSSLLSSASSMHYLSIDLFAISFSLLLLFFLYLFAYSQIGLIS